VSIGPYTTEKQDEIIKNFKDLLKEADNFPRDKNPDDYKIFWTSLRREGSNLLGLTLHLLSILELVEHDDSLTEKSKKENE